MIVVLFYLLLLPASACLAGIVTWWIYRHDENNDAELFRFFTFILVGVMLLAWGISRTDAARMKMDPVFRIQTELNSHPVYKILEEVSPDDFAKLDKVVKPAMAEGKTLQQAFNEARPMLNLMAIDRLGFADQATRIQWGTQTVNSLKLLEMTSAPQCYKQIASKSARDLPTGSVFSAENNTEFQQAVAAVYASADRGMRHEYPKDEQHVELDDMQRQYRDIMTQVEQKFGAEIKTALSTKSFPATTHLSESTLCAARIYQLELILAQPKAMAARLIDAVLR